MEFYLVVFLKVQLSAGIVSHSNFSHAYAKDTPLKRDSADLCSSAQAITSIFASINVGLYLWRGEPGDSPKPGEIPPRWFQPTQSDD